MSNITLRDYTALYKIKEFMANDVAPKYFNLESIDDTNVGLFGYITEILANNVEDSFFATTMLFKEIFPVTAEDPDSIYLMAALFQMDNHFATPSRVGFNILIAEDDVISHATYADGFYTLELDRDMKISIDNIEFMLDYDIRIMSRKAEGGYTHTALYIFNFNNGVSDVTSPYIATRVHTHTDNNKRYVLLTVYLHQVTKTTIEDTVLTNDTINIVTKEYSYDGQLANFEIYYRESSNQNWTQMTKYIANSTNVSRDPSFYYKFIDEGKIAISFNTDDRYFIPKYNSELKVEMYTTLGEDGNFEKYTGEELSIAGVSTRYASNKGLIFIGNVRGSALGGYNAKTIEELRTEVIKAFSTVKSFTTANDLTLYFNSLRLNNNNELLIIKQRDDALKRLFSSFVLFKDENKNIIPTNTVNIHFTPDEIDMSYPQTNRHVLNAGKLYAFNPQSRNFVHHRADLSIESDLDQFEGNEYIYINPFLTVIGLSPTLVGYYINTINDTLPLNFKEVNTASFNQFIANNIEISRNGLAGEDQYKVTIKLYPSSKLPSPAFTVVNEDTLVTPEMRTFINPTDGLEYIDNDVIKCTILFDDTPNVFLNLRLSGFDADCYYMTAYLKTNDYVSLNNKLQIIEGFSSLATGEAYDQPAMITSYETKATIYTFLKYPESTTAGVHPFIESPELADATMTNIYTADSNLNFIIPVPEIISTLRYVDEGNDRYSFDLYSVPMVKANIMKTKEDFNSFLESFRSMYEYLQNAMESLTNNFQIDLKFFNTYGPSRHFYYFRNSDDASALMDKVNISIHFGIKFTITNGIENAVTDVKTFIKEYIESDSVSLISSPSLYISNLIRDIQNNFQNISYITFKGVNDYGENIQKFESEVNDINVLEGSFATNDVIPEYLNIDYIYKKNTKTPQIIIDVL